MLLFHLLATVTQTHLTQTKRQQQDSENSIFCTQRLAITGTSAPALADQKLSTSFSAVAEAFLLSWYAFCLLQPPPFTLTVLAFYFHLLLSICDSWFAVLFPTLLLCFCLRSSFCKSPALRSVGSKDTCGGCVHSCTFVRFIKGKPAEWNCSFCNNCGDCRERLEDRKEMREEDPDGKKKYWLSRFTSVSPSQWLMEGLKGGFKKARCLGGWMGYIRYCQKKQQKVENKKKIEFFFSVWATDTSLECTKCLSLMDFSYQTTKQNLLDHHRLHPHNLIVRLRKCSVEPGELWLYETNVERSKIN